MQKTRPGPRVFSRLSLKRRPVPADNRKVGNTEKASLFPGIRDDYEKQTDAPFTGSLTGLYNHGFFLELVGRELKRFLRYGVPFSLAFLGIDGLRRYNRRRGPIKGDRALKQALGIIRESMRESDLAARYLGDMFAVLLLDAPIDDAETVGRRLGAATEKHFQGEFTVCVGWASSEKTFDKDELIRKANGVLAYAKAKGRGSIRFAVKPVVWRSLGNGDLSSVRIRWDDSTRGRVGACPDPSVFGPRRSEAATPRNNRRRLKRDLS